ncbi:MULTISPECIES: YXWGXW repeat-containing protein [Bradyrhizobium]|uniref:YXWGXW repeat-containing protein n=1 Tax=Bradyrhizobium elkanii TaxID=29448 RepID=UPI00068460AB|nr:YXWGXW repeat-containing protein [Bradyrhizobium elkanii]
MRRFLFIIGLLAALIISPVTQAQIISITIAPPELPVYEQPPLPAPGYIWTPGYWAYSTDGYYWVPGTWVEPPAVGLLWTPGYWAWRDGVYAWNTGYWGPRVGFYGGVNYGFGYGGVGYEGGHWDNGVLAYNRTINNFGSVNVTNVYSKTVINNNITRVSFNGGSGGITSQPTAQEQVAAQDHHVAPAPAQIQQQHLASTNRALLASENHGRPAIAATAKPGEFTGKGVVAAREAKPGPAPLPQPVAPKAPANNAVANKPLESKPLAAAPPGNKPVANDPPAANKSRENKASVGSEHAAPTNGALPKPPNAAVRPEAKPLNAAAKPANVAAKPVAAPPAPKPGAVAAAPKPPQHPSAAPAPHRVAAASHPASRPAPHPPAAKRNVSPHNEAH